MRLDAQKLEADRLDGISIENYPWVHERHRIFPQVFEDRGHKKVIDISSGIGIIAKNIINAYPCDLFCNEVDKTCLREMKKLNVNLLSFDLDTGHSFPLKERLFDAIICLATLEHIINIDLFVSELHRILKEDGQLYLSVPNYASLYWMVPLLRGRTFHNPLVERSRYEFYAHVRYFTYQTLIEFMHQFGFDEDAVYLPLPRGSSRFMRIRDRSRIAGFLIQYFFRLLYQLSPRWHQEPVICFSKHLAKGKRRKVIL
jgi:2-polyprenyl-3-methyl-5-hydroxy-6-metoxy-1,4-benzoquinol methylase